MSEKHIRINYAQAVDEGRLAGDAVTPEEMRQALRLIRPRSTHHNHNEQPWWRRGVPRTFYFDVGSDSGGVITVIIEPFAGFYEAGFSVGFAFCAPTDMFSRKHGSNLARTRLRFRAFNLKHIMDRLLRFNLGGLRLDMNDALAQVSADMVVFLLTEMPLPTWLEWVCSDGLVLTLRGHPRQQG